MILLAGIRHTTLRIYCVFEMFEEYLLRRLKKHFQELFTENYGGVFYNNNLVESCIGFAACSRNALVRRQHYWGYWQLLGNFRICLRHAVLLRYILEMHLYRERFGHMDSGKL